MNLPWRGWALASRAARGVGEPCPFEVHPEKSGPELLGGVPGFHPAADAAGGGNRGVQAAETSCGHRDRPVKGPLISDIAHDLGPAVGPARLDCLVEVLDGGERIAEGGVVLAAVHGLSQPDAASLREVIAPSHAQLRSRSQRSRPTAQYRREMTRSTAPR